jgi:uncharacterized membrane protein affecting hemolysin expression
MSKSLLRRSVSVVLVLVLVMAVIYGIATFKRGEAETTESKVKEATSIAAPTYTVIKLEYQINHTGVELAELLNTNGYEGWELEQMTSSIHKDKMYYTLILRLQ